MSRIECTPTAVIVALLFCGVVTAPPAWPQQSSASAPASTPVATSAASGSAETPFARLAMTCAPGVHPDLLGRVATVESSGNRFAIGVVGGHLTRQPSTLDEALATIRALNEGGWNYSLGIVQVNVHNLERFGQTLQTIFDPCTNLKTGAAILAECYGRAQGAGLAGDTAVHAALSCYYSGDLSRGRAYALKVAASAPVSQVRGAASESQAIPVVPDVSGAPAAAATNTRSAPPHKTADAKKHDNWFTTWGEDDTSTARSTGYHALPDAISNTERDGDSN
ncbi:lytic transglycosylase domain-containing protein [Trinickia violacea]|uniref:Lytic transglycosylase domain-containing protein n=1 Tax=Trinickia violacea TaxID=2571746 RepID=A0A4P8J2E5_9BURK|nr:lytic transglycosylase domain-containing protein [Trinickia violacea]QCP55127.1 lytic transglycosylase domain-containing protein [Trinickia violacea]